MSNKKNSIFELALDNYDNVDWELFQISKNIVLDDINDDNID